jgi:hypothetical protein
MKAQCFQWMIIIIRLGLIKIQNEAILSHHIWPLVKFSGIPSFWEVTFKLDI